MNPPRLTSRYLRPFPYTEGMVRLVVPPATIGAYLLLRDEGGRAVPMYVGRSDTDLRRRLLEHPYRTLDSFVIEPCETPEAAALAEAMAYRRFRPPLNRVYPTPRPATAGALEWPVYRPQLVDPIGQVMSREGDTHA